jgi:hypothetical protein
MTAENIIIFFAALPQEKRIKDSRTQQLDFRTEYMYYFIEIKTNIR